MTGRARAFRTAVIATLTPAGASLAAAQSVAPDATLGARQQAALAALAATGQPQPVARASRARRRPWHAAAARGPWPRAPARGSERARSVCRRCRADCRSRRDARADRRAGGGAVDADGSARQRRLPCGAGARRDGQRQDRALRAPGAAHHRPGPACVDPGAGDRAHAPGRLAVPGGLRRPRRHPAQRAGRWRAPRSVASHPARRRGPGGGHAVGRLRAPRSAGPGRRRRGARRVVQAGRDAALQRP